METNKDYSGYTDSQLVRAVLERFGLKQRELAAMLMLSEGQISNVIHERTTLRPLVRQRVVDMLWMADKNFIVG